MCEERRTLLFDDAKNVMQYRIKKAGGVFALTILFAAAAAAQEDTRRPQLQPANTSRAAAEARTRVALADEVRHRLVMLPDYGVFDWLQFEISPDASIVTLLGEAREPVTKTEAARVAKDLEDITTINNQIQVLPASPSDDRLRRALYRTIYDWNSPLFRYASQAVPPIHIIVNNGRITLEGVVASEADSRLAYMAARGVPNVFSVTNNLRVEARNERN